LFHAVEQLQKAFSGRYVVERELGRGGMATVYLALDLRHNRRVAIKVFRAEYAAGVEADRFRGEIEIAAALAHPGIVPVFDSGGVDDVLYYVMPYIEGESLRSLLGRQSRLSVDQTLRIARDVGDALAYAHARGIVHRDVKPENILLVESRAVVADFGIARALARATTSDRLTVEGVAVGTPLYMSPEQASGEHEVDGRSDMYSLASVVYEMLTGGAPHAAPTPRDVLLRKLLPEPQLASLDRPDIPEGTRAAIRRALSYRPQDRFDTTREFVDVLIGGVITPTPTLQISRVDAVIRRLTHRRRFTRVVAGAVAVFIAVAGFALWRNTRTPALADDGRVSIAVLPFRATVAAASELAEAVPDLLATALDGTPGMRVADPWALWRTLRASPGAAPHAPDPDEAARLAEQAHASVYVLGSIAQLQQRIEITLRVYRRGGGEPWHTLSVAGASDSIATIVQRLAIDLIRQVTSVESSKSLATFDRGLTRSPDALKSWLAARELHRRGRVDSADAAIAKALALDSTFAFALIDAVQIRSWLQFLRGEMYAGLAPLAQRAARLSDSLPERHRLRAAAYLASIRTEGTQASEALERIIAIDSSDVEAWGMLSYINLVYGWQFGRGERDARTAVEQALRLDPTDATNVARLTWISVATNDERLDDLHERLTRLDTTFAVVRGSLRSIEAVRANDAAFATFVDRSATASPFELIAVIRALRVLRPDRAELLARKMVESPSVATRRIGLGALVQILAAGSRWGTVDSLRRSGAFAQSAGFERIVDRLTVAASIAGTVDEPTARRAVSALAANVTPDSALAWFNSRPVWLEGWLVGGWHAMYGDTVLARRWYAALGTLPKSGSPAEYAAALRADIESRLAARRGDRAAALRSARRAMELWSIHTENVFEYMPEPAMRYHLASLLRASGNADSAETMFRSMVAPTTWLGTYTARASLELGELAQARGDRAYAERSFLVALRMWEHSDSIAAAFRERARRGTTRDRN
jgi:serine/threonine-protein kinase